MNEYRTIKTGHYAMDNFSEVLKPYAEIYKKFILELNGELEKSDRKAVFDAACEVSMTNCGADTYMVANLMLNLAKRVK